jgi:hypothetical protein
MGLSEKLGAFGAFGASDHVYFSTFNIIPFKIIKIKYYIIFLFYSIIN